MTLTVTSGTGVARADCDRVELDVTTTRVAKTSAEAKARAKLAMAELYKVLDALRQSGAGVPEELAAHFSISKAWDKDRVFIGYKAIHHLTVETRALDWAGEIFDALTEVADLEVGSPTFHLDESKRQELKNLAFERAVAAAKARFAWQARVVGFDPEAHKITSWRHEGADRGMIVSKRSRSSGSSVSVVGSQAKVELTVQLSYE